MAKAKPFRWIGDVENRTLWLKRSDGTIKIISAGGEVKKEENLTGIDLDWQKAKEKAGLLQFLDFGDRMGKKGEDGQAVDDGAVGNVGLGAEPLTEDQQNIAQTALDQSLATTKAIEKNNKVKADRDLEKAIDASDKREQTVSGNAEQPNLGEGIGA